MTKYKTQRFKYHFHRHGDREWVIYVVNKPLITDQIICNVATTTLVEHDRAYITGIGDVHYSRELTIIC